MQTLSRLIRAVKLTRLKKLMPLKILTQEKNMQTSNAYSEHTFRNRTFLSVKQTNRSTDSVIVNCQ